MLFFLSPAILNRCNPNGFMPNQVGELAISSDTVTPSADAARLADMVKNMADTVTATDSAAKASNIALTDIVRMDDWTKQKKAGSDFRG